MMTIKEYFNNILVTEGYDAWEEATDELLALVAADEEAWVEDKESHLVEAWAEEHNIDLAAGRMVMGTFTTYYQSWYWDFCE